jgi:uncharacterized protein (DUF924 family)
MINRDDPERVLSFWLALDENAQFGGGGQIDSQITEDFGALLSEATQGRFDWWADTPRGALALVILLDQFSRNIHRGTPLMYAGDRKALAVANAALEKGFDQAVGSESLWFYMPFMHSERLADQECCIELLTKAGFATNLPYAFEHRELIARFGRFPHRNHILGRESTDEEKAYLAAGRLSGVTPDPSE